MALSPVSTSFTAQPNGGAFGINAYGSDFVEVNGARFNASLLLRSDIGPTELSGLSPEGLQARHLEMLAQWSPEIVLVGTGSRQRFLSPLVMAPMLRLRIGVECMTLAAACRTFNLLASEGRRTAAFLLFDRLAASAPAAEPTLISSLHKD
ncbi:MAG: hypothetical protein EBR85_05130 [Betaproteobacteria bacterium]|nr:hypothetical protein [Betaproteobacteria bacterium]